MFKQKMKKKGFTLIELLSVIVILAIIALITVPLVYRVVRKAKDELSVQNVEGYINAAEMAVSKHGFDTDDDISGVYDITQTGIKKQGTDLELVVSAKGNRPTSGTITFDEDANVIDVNIPISSDKSIIMNDQGNLEKVSADNPGGSGGDSGDDVPEYVEVNTPDLLTNMVPVKYDGTNWVYANTSDTWYDYSKKEWANAVVLNKGVTKSVGDTIPESDVALWYVWIPRYKYQLFNVNNEGVEEQLINVVFENGTETTGTVTCTIATTGVETCTNAENGNWYTHPAFTFGNQQLTGYWVGKFEVSTTDATCNNSSDLSTRNTNCDKVLPVTIKPDTANWQGASLVKYYDSVKAMSGTYSITDGDTHMMKNMEWGAVAYLKQSKYGLGMTDIAINDRTGLLSILTGDGDYKNNTDQSTTGNIYGIYDMSGGARERVMGNMVDSSGNFYPSESGFTSAPDSKYYDRYAYFGPNSSDHARGHLGDATRETLKTFGSDKGGWYEDFSRFPYSNVSWLERGGSSTNGSNSGVFQFSTSYGIVGDAATVRAVLTKK